MRFNASSKSMTKGLATVEEFVRFYARDAYSSNNKRALVRKYKTGKKLSMCFTIELIEARGSKKKLENPKILNPYHSIRRP